MVWYGFTNGSFMRFGFVFRGGDSYALCWYFYVEVSASLNVFGGLRVFFRVCGDSFGEFAPNARESQ